MTVKVGQKVWYQSHSGQVDSGTVIQVGGGPDGDLTEIHWPRIDQPLWMKTERLLLSEPVSEADAPDDFRDLVVRELTEVIIANACDRTERHAIKVAEAIADRLTCPDCGFIDIGLGNVDNRCNDCTPKHALRGTGEQPHD